MELERFGGGVVWKQTGSDLAGESSKTLGLLDARFQCLEDMGCFGIDLGSCSLSNRTVSRPEV